MEFTLNQKHIETQAQHFFESLASGRIFRQNLFTAEGLTFEEIYNRMDNLRDLFIREVNKDSPLCLCTEDRARIAIALLAVLKGGPQLVVPHSFDTAALKEAQKNTPFTHALVEQESQLPDGIQELKWPQRTRPSDRHPTEMSITLDSTWLYLFTGGSTGTAQIWSKTPRNLLMEAVHIKNTFDIKEDDIILATVPPNHIYGMLYSILLPLVTGAGVSMRTPTFPNEIIQSIEETNATVLVSIPAHYRALKPFPLTHHKLKIAFSSAGALAQEDSLGFYNNTGIGVTEIYGSTETGGIAQRNRAKGQTALIPFECVDVQIQKNEHLQVRSHFLSSKLVKSEDGFFETADRAQWTDSSGFALLGRSDGIVKVGGKRVDLAKTRETLMQVKGVEDVYVFAIQVKSGRENEIVALVEGRVTAGRIHQAVNMHLPAYARPRNIKIIEQIPLSSTGKYNRTAIKKIFKGLGS
jgi:acyl-coenzyme A synthetase/AMP-(fatty) acid ligase